MTLRSTSALDTRFISAGKDARSSSSSAAARKSASKKRSTKRKSAGKNSNLDFDRDGRPPTLPYKTLLWARMRREPEFAVGILCEGINALLACELNVGKN